MELVFGRRGRSLRGYSVVLSLVFRCHTQFERHGLWGIVWDGRNERFWGFAIVAPLKDVIGYGPWGRATNK